MGITDFNKDNAEDAKELDELECTSLIIANCFAFVAITLIIVGELMHEGNTWGVLVVGGGVCTLNVLQTSYRMERYLNKEKKRKAEMSPGSGNTKEIPHRTQVYVGDAVSIDIDGLSEERYRDEQTYNHKFLEEEDDIVLRQHRKSRKSDRKHSDRKHPKRRRERNDKERVQSTGFMNEDEPLSRRYRRKRKSKSRALESDMDPLEIVERKGKKLKKKSKRKPKVRLAERDTIIGV